MKSQAHKTESWGAPTLESTKGKPQGGAPKFSFLKVLDGERNWVQEGTDTDYWGGINNLLEKLLVPLRETVHMAEWSFYTFLRMGVVCQHKPTARLSGYHAGGRGQDV